jgi:NADPH-dependent curcumin reductase CurA
VVLGGRVSPLGPLEDMLQGMEAAPGSITGLYAGENMGKRLIQVGPA